jgi:hypothetical protein
MLSFYACTKNSSEQINNKASDVPPVTTVTKLSYGDSILYLKNSASDYIVKPLVAKKGRYSAFPEGINLDENTGAINISKSETGLRYRIDFQGDDGTKDTAVVLLSGINYVDEYFNLSLGNSILYPVYNGNARNGLPSGSFDEEAIASNSGCSIKTNNGEINLLQTVHNGFFGQKPQNGDKKEIEIQYRLGDKSGYAKQRIKVLLYYYNSMNDVPAYLKQIVDDHLVQMFRTSSSDQIMAAKSVVALAKPRPPCIIIVGQ